MLHNIDLGEVVDIAISAVLFTAALALIAAPALIAVYAISAGANVWWIAAGIFGTLFIAVFFLIREERR